MERTSEGVPQRESRDKYDPRQFFQRATDPMLFREQLPGFVNDIATKSVPKLDHDTTRVLGQMNQQMSKFWNEGAPLMLTSLSSMFARRQGWVREEHMGKLSFEMPLRHDEFSDEQRQKWEEYVYRDGVSRKDAIEAFNNLRLVHFNQFPSTNHINNPVMDKLRTRLTKVPYQLADKFFPDLNDEEAKRLFNCPAEDVRKLAKDANEQDITGKSID